MKTSKTSQRGRKGHRPRAPGTVTRHTIHIFVRNGQLKFVQSPPDRRNNDPNAAAVVHVDVGDTVKWRGRTGRNFALAFIGDSPLDDAVYGGVNNGDSKEGTVQPPDPGLPTPTPPGTYKYFVVVTDPALPNGFLSVDPEIVIT